MTTTINTYAAGAHLDDLRRVAELRRAGASVELGVGGRAERLHAALRASWRLTPSVCG